MNERIIEQEIKQFHKIWFAEYIAKALAVEYKFNGNSHSITYNKVYDSCFDKINYSEKEKEEIYQNVDDILTNKYNLIFAHNNRDESVYLVDISESED